MGRQGLVFLLGFLMGGALNLSLMAWTRQDPPDEELLQEAQVRRDAGLQLGQMTI